MSRSRRIRAASAESDLDTVADEITSNTLNQSDQSDQSGQSEMLNQSDESDDESDQSDDESDQSDDDELSATPLEITASGICVVKVLYKRRPIKDYAFDLSALNKTTLSFIFNYGLRQIIRDSATGTKSPTEAVALADKRASKVLANTVHERSPRIGTLATNPVDELAIKNAYEDLVKRLKTRAKELGEKFELKTNRERYLKHAARMVETDPKWREAARAELERQAGLQPLSDAELDALLAG